MRRKLVISLIIIGLLVPDAVLGAPLAHYDTQIEDPEVLELMEEMSAEQRVGQLFLVTFDGADASASSEVGRLVREGRVGGVVLSARRDNLEDGEDVLLQVLRLSNDLQALATDAPPTQESGTLVPSPEPLDGPYIPLFVAVEQLGPDYSYALLRSGVTPLPTNMALGATWDAAYAEEVGAVAGRELDALGINMLLGPSFDVMEETPPEGGELGVQSFGGDPYWVSQMGEAYVRGVHRGSNGRVAVVPKHFPGLGSADRPTDVEVSTVPRSLARLVQVDLAPFFAVTNTAADPGARADGLLTAHIRYLGFQGDNPRLATRPISLDPQALQVLMTQPQVISWRQEGGLLVSGALGERSIRRFYDPSEASFPSRRIAQDAFLAGNDLLYLADFGPSVRGDETETLLDTLDFFVQKYSEDPTFQARVDASVARILRQKLDQFGPFSPARMHRPDTGLEEVGQAADITVQVSQAAVTLLSPTMAELADPPQEDDLIVIFTDTRTVRQCSTCEALPRVRVDALGNAILNLYGPGASGLVRPGNIQSYSFTALSDLMEFGPPVPEDAEEGVPTAEPNPVEIALANADWVIFVMLDPDPVVDGADAVKRFLAERPDLASNANVVVMAMDAPYFLDSTEISKLSAYYALYDGGDAFVNTAARVLFQEVLPGGASPVTVSGINYNLLSVTSPDPTQIIELYAGDASPGAASTPEPLALDPGDALRVQTGPILDRNGNIVPDGTPVDFDVNFVSEGLHNVMRVTTLGGVAQANLVLDRVGQIEVTAISEPASLSFTLFVNVQESGATVISQPPQVTPTATVVATLEPLEQSTDGAGIVPTPAPVPPPPTGHMGVTFQDFLLAMAGLLLIGGLAYRFGRRRASGHVNDGLWYGLPGVVVGLLVYNLYALRLLGRARVNGALNVPLAAWGGAVLGVMVAVGFGLWRTWRASWRR